MHTMYLVRCHPTKWYPVRVRALDLAGDEPSRTLLCNDDTSGKSSGHVENDISDRGGALKKMRQ